jgi:hypothetical protein
VSRIENVSLTPSEYRNAVFIDFEGRKSLNGEHYPLPYMAGVFRPRKKGKNGTYEAVFFKESWKPAANGSSGRARIADIESFTEELLEEISTEDKRVVHWTIHEKEILQRHLPASLFKQLEPFLYNVHPIARRYANRFRKFGVQQSAKGKTLEEFFSVLYQKRNPYPPLPLGPSIVCQRIDRACERTQRWRKFTDKQQEYVRDLLAYNEGDCRATWLIARRIGNFYASELCDS